MISHSPETEWNQGCVLKTFIRAIIDRFGSLDGAWHHLLSTPITRPTRTRSSSRQASYRSPSSILRSRLRWTLGPWAWSWATNWRTPLTIKVANSTRTGIWRPGGTTPPSNASSSAPNVLSNNTARTSRYDSRTLITTNLNLHIYEI